MLKGLKTIFFPEKLVLTEEFTNGLNALEETSENYFLTGKAGTGKSTLLQQFRHKSKKKVAVLAPTGLAAINIGGQTIHSFFHFPPQMITPDVIHRAHNNDRIYKQVDTIVIDEASMVRADMLDGIDLFLRKFGRDKNAPFGGIQIILVGDLFQLPPVLRNEEREIIDRSYESPYFISAKAFDDGNFRKLELTKIFRQKDEAFIATLNKVRMGNVSGEVLSPINDRLKKRGELDRNKFVTLTTTNRVATEINLSQLLQLPQPEYTYVAEVVDDFPTVDVSLPVDLELRLRRGARVMFVKNGGVYVNGTLGFVTALSLDKIVVKIDESGDEVEVPRETWENIRYVYNEDEGTIEPIVRGALKQFPLRLAWAITIHKSQGMTFSKVNIDFSASPFAHGQTYVALSRCQTLNGITLSKHIYPNDVIVDERIIRYLE